MRRFLKGAGGSVIGAGVGAATSFASSMASARVDFLKAGNNWWATPAVLVLIGHFLKKKNPALGYGILGAAGVIGVENFTGTPANARGFDSGIGDAGLLFNEGQATDASPMTNSGINPHQAGALLGMGAMGFDNYSSAGELVNDHEVMGLEA